MNKDYSIKNMSLAAAARYLNLSPDTMKALPIERLVLPMKGEYKCYGYRFSKADLDAFVKANTVSS